MLFSRLGLCITLSLLTIELGAQQEWPYSPVQRPEIPAVAVEDWAINDVDRFIQARLDSKQLIPTQTTDKRTLVRRLYLDLLGLPPSTEEQRSFLDDTSEDAYANLVNRLLDDPRYGEHWARYWLDLARYADTAGYEGDRICHMPGGIGIMLSIR